MVSLPALEQGKMVVSMKAEVLRGHNLPKPHVVGDSIYYVVVTVDGVEYKSSMSKKGDRSPVWADSSFEIPVSESTQMSICICCSHGIIRPGPSHVICTASELRILEFPRNQEISIKLPTRPGSSSSQKQAMPECAIRLSVLPEFSPTPDDATEYQERALEDFAKIGIISDISHSSFARVTPEWRQLIMSLGTFAKFAEKIASLDPKAKVALGAVVFALQVVIDQIERDFRVDRLAGTMSNLYDFFLDASPLHKILSFEKSAKRLVSQTAECAHFIAAYIRTESFKERAVKNMGTKTDLLLTDYEAAFGELRVELVMGTTLQTALTTVRILDKVTSLENLMFVDRLPYLRGASWNPHRTCVRGTHDALIDHIMSWIVGGVNDKGYGQRIFFLMGRPGCGKSSVAHSIAQRFHDEGRLGCAIFLEGAIEGKNNSQIISSTMARNLAGFDDVIMARMNGPIRKDLGLAYANIERQFSELIVAPTEGLTMVGPVLIILDGLHECDDLRERKRLLKVLTDETLMTRFPTNFRFLITSRPEDDVEAAFQDGLGHCERYNMDFDSQGGSQDGETMIRETLKLLYSERPALFGDRAITHVQEELVNRAMGVHLWASTALKVLKSYSNTAGALFLDIVMGRRIPETPEESMGHLYSAILQAIVPTLSPTNRIGWHEVFSDLIQSRTHFSLSLLAFLSPGVTNLIKLLQDLGMVVDKLNATTFARTRLHRTFEDFITDKRRCTDTRFYVDITQPYLPQLAEECLDVMNQLLRHNLCNFSNPSLLNSEVEDLDSRIDKHIRKALRYASQHWISHFLNLRMLSEAIRTKLRILLTQHLLHWLEVLSVLDLLDDTVMTSNLEQLDEWMTAFYSPDSEEKLLTRDAIRFIRGSSSVISKASLHIYISVLPLFPSNTLLHSIYIKEIIPERPRVASSSEEYGSCLRVMKGHRAWVNRAVFSPDGSIIASCSSDESIRLWNAHTGSLIGAPLRGHEQKEIYHVAFSPDGSRLLSAADDMTIHVWNVRTGQLALEPLKGHRNWVRWVEYSSDGTKIVSASYDKEIRIWDSSGKKVGQPLQGHKDYINCAVFTPDGKQIASASWDATVRIWDAEACLAIGNPLFGHTDQVTCVAYSPDGAQLVSASTDTTIRLWNPNTRQKVAVFNGHEGWIRSVAFSADGWRLASAAKDNTIRIWNLQFTGMHQVGKFIRGHTDCVTSAAFSPDGQQIVSSSWDYTVRVWDLHQPQSDIPSSPTFSQFYSEAPTPTITFLGPFEDLKHIAARVDKEGWICTYGGQRLLWVPYSGCELGLTASGLNVVGTKGNIMLTLIVTS